MRKQRFKTIRLLLKLMLLLQIYSYHKFTVAEATENTISENFDKCKVEDQADSNGQLPETETEESVLERPKKPARLLPLKMIRYIFSSITTITSNLLVNLLILYSFVFFYTI